MFSSSSNLIWGTLEVDITQCQHTLDELMKNTSKNERKIDQYAVKFSSLLCGA